jgi:hypothetical protein
VAEIVAPSSPTARRRSRPASGWCRTWPAARSTAALRDDTARRIADIRASAEGREGVQAFLGKREPAWLHRRRST